MSKLNPGAVVRYLYNQERPVSIGQIALALGRNREETEEVMDRLANSSIVQAFTRIDAKGHTPFYRLAKKGTAA
jgi:predicted ArsR family transcriptional regulator